LSTTLEAPAVAQALRPRLLHDALARTRRSE
jgi:hypothetical protein